MGIPLGEQRAPGHPVVKRTEIGQDFVGAVFNVQQRDRLKKNDATGLMEPMMRNGKPRKELVVSALAMPGTTAPAGLGDEQGIPEPGTAVRLILKGKSYADWIQAERELGRQLQVGDVVKTRTDSAQVYDADGNPKGDLLTTQEQVDAVPRNTTVGIYAKLKLEPGEGEWVDKAEAAYKAEEAARQQANATPLDSGGGQSSAPIDEEPW